MLATKVVVYLQVTNATNVNFMVRATAINSTGSLIAYNAIGFNNFATKATNNLVDNRSVPHARVGASGNYNMDMHVVTYGFDYQDKIVDTSTYVEVTGTTLYETTKSRLLNKTTTTTTQCLRIAVRSYHSNAPVLNPDDYRSFQFIAKSTEWFELKPGTAQFNVFGELKELTSNSPQIVMQDQPTSITFEESSVNEQK